MRSTTCRGLVELWRAGVKAVSGRSAVHRALQQDRPFKPDLTIAIGKAASAMYLGAADTWRQPIKSLIITKDGHVDAALYEQQWVRIIEAGHPIPDQRSLDAGACMLSKVGQLGTDASLLLLVSGGASALAECLPQDIDLAHWQQQTEAMVASGMTIGEINAERRRVSLLKGGKLLEVFQGRYARVYAISDVQGDLIGTIGSGIGNIDLAQCQADARVIASNLDARNAVAEAATARGFKVQHNQETLYADVYQVAAQIAANLASGAPGLYIWGGEPTIQLPPNPGRGGRNQSLALALAKLIGGRTDLHVLVAGTDGTDGPTDAAGAVIDGTTWPHDPVGAEQALAQADAGPYLEAYGQLLITGATDTNVMDLVIAQVS